MLVSGTLKARYTKNFIGVSMPDFRCSLLNSSGNRTKDKEKNNTVDDLQHLGFNGGQGGVTITEEVVKDLEEAIKNGYWDHFANDGFFWGQQFQEEQVNEYKAQDEKFLALV